jgi:hypothetical protein
MTLFSFDESIPSAWTAFRATAITVVISGICRLGQQPGPASYDQLHGYAGVRRLISCITDHTVSSCYIEHREVLKLSVRAEHFDGI